MRNGSHLPLFHGPVLRLDVGRTPAPVVRNGRHKELVERMKSARNASRKANEPHEQLLIATEFAYVRQEVVKVRYFALHLGT